jgi:hypothetical protein
VAESAIQIRRRGSGANPHIVVIGAGFTGLAAAYQLTSLGMSVTVLEGDAEVGGLAGCFEVNGERLEKFYHHWFVNDFHIMQLIGELDGDGQVIQKTGSFAQTNLPQTATGNMFNADNEMIAFNGTPLSYDANGNLTNDGTNTYAWDARNHLISLSGANAASFVYDPVGRRASSNSGKAKCKHRLVVLCRGN